MPTACHSLEIKRATLEIPVAGRHNFYTAVRQVSIKVRHCVFQRICGFFNRQGLGNNPYAELPAFQPTLAVRDHRAEEILLRLIEETKMGTPGDVANDVNPGFPR